jgi:nitroimidazol reductase NimA-like FMN-containing flavoprotein (pyridoxamine 5'-phosphate oxidase superfamily)
MGDPDKPPRDRSEADGPHMSPQALDAFLERPLIARLATSARNRPRVLPVWFLWDGTDIWMETSATFPNARILRENPHAAIAIDEAVGPFAFRAAIFRGVVDVIAEPYEDVMRMVRGIYRRYLSDDELASVEGEMVLSAHHVLLQFHPRRVITWDTTGEA